MVRKGKEPVCLAQGGDPQVFAGKESPGLDHASTSTFIVSLLQVVPEPEEKVWKYERVNYTNLPLQLWQVCDLHKLDASVLVPYCLHLVAPVDIGR